MENKTFSYCGFDWTLEFVEPTGIDNNPDWGNVNFEKHKILINSTISKQNQQETLLHELIHIALKQSGEWDMLSFSEQESLVTSLSLNLYGIIKTIDLFTMFNNE